MLGIRGLPPGAAWLAAVQNPPAHVILAEVGRGVRGLLSTLFWRSPWSGPLQGGEPGRAALAGAIAGLARGLPASGLGQGFAWPYLLGWPGAALPGVTPALWAASLLGAAAGLGLLLRPQWRAAVAAAAGRRGAAPAPELLSVAAAAVPAFLLAWLLRHLTVHLQAAASVGVFLAVTGDLILLGAGWARRDTQVGEAVPPWAAAATGIVAGAAALPGISRLAILLLGGLGARARPQAAGSFALMAAAGTAALLGLAALPGALMGPAGALALFPVAGLAAAGGAYAGGLLLLRFLGAAGRAPLPAVASTVAAVAGLLLLLGVFGA